MNKIYEQSPYITVVSLEISSGMVRLLYLDYLVLFFQLPPQFRIFHLFRIRLDAHLTAALHISDQSTPAVCDHGVEVVERG